MPGPAKRTRTELNLEGHDESLTMPTTPSSSARPPPQPRRISTTPITPSRPIPTRSATSTLPNTPTHLTRSTSLFIPTRLGLGTNGGGTLSRTQSTSSIPFAAPSKASVAPGGGGIDGKGGDTDMDWTGARRLGKGKENIPPRKDEEQQGDASRKRVKISRGRSGSVTSMRSEVFGPRSSVAPSCSSLSSRRARFTSPTPSLSSTTTRSFDSIALVDPLDVIDDAEERDANKTPTKSRPVTRRTYTMPTPPPSSPFPDLELEVTPKKIDLIRAKSSTACVTSDETDIELVKGKTNPYKYLKSYLRLSAGAQSSADQTIVGREHEKTVLRAYLHGEADKDVGMYVSGPPGTGKTALVTALGRELAADGWQVVELGCMGLKIADIWRRLGEAMGCGRLETDVQAFLSKNDTNTLIILDEIDALLPPPPCLPPPVTSNLLSKLFSLPLFSRTKLVAISNTLDLTFRARLVLPESLQPIVLPFKAYGGSDMIDIVNARIAAACSDLDTHETVKVDAKALELLTKKVGAQNGDLRMCLGVLASAVSLAETEWLKKTLIADSIPYIKVSVPHAIKAFNSHTQQLRAAAGSMTASTSSTGKKIRSVPLQGKMVLISILVYLSRTRAGLPGCPTISPTKSMSLEALSVASLYATYAHILSHHTSPFPAASESDYRDLLSNLEVLGLISLTTTIGPSGMSRSSSGTTGRTRHNSGISKIELCAREEEVKDGLGLDASGKGSAEEEVSKVWEREDAKVQRAREKAAASAIAKATETMEDPFC